MWNPQRHNRQRFESDSGYSHNLSWGHWLQFYWVWLMVEAELNGTSRNLVVYPTPGCSPILANAYRKLGQHTLADADKACP